MSFFKNHWLLTLACVIIILPAFSFLSNRFYYAKALALLETGNYAEAFVILNDLGSYRDSAQYAKIIKETYNSDLVKLISRGNIVSFGTYEQEDIEWIVLTKELSRILLISRYALDNIDPTFTDNYGIWNKSALRWWLNNKFINEAFSASERSRILERYVDMDKNPEDDYAPKPENGTRDKIFVLSISEANSYFMFDADRMCKPTFHAEDKGCFVDSNTGNGRWYLRTRGYGNHELATVNPDGSINYGGYQVPRSIGIRPALWLEIDG